MVTLFSVREEWVPQSGYPSFKDKFLIPETITFRLYRGMLVCGSTSVPLMASRKSDPRQLKETPLEEYFFCLSGSKLNTFVITVTSSKGEIPSSGYLSVLRIHFCPFLILSERLSLALGKHDSLDVRVNVNCGMRLGANSNNRARPNFEEDYLSPNKRKIAKNSAKIATPVSTETRNKFSPLNKLTDTQEEEIVLHKPKAPVPPIMLTYFDKYPEMLANIKKACGPTDNKFSNDIIKIFPGTCEKHTQISNFCRTQGYDFYILKPKQRPLKAVIKRLPPNQDPKEIKDALEELGFSISKVVQLTKLRTRQPLPFYLVEINKKENSEKIYDLHKFKNLIIEIVPFRGRNAVNQCYNCNYFHHNADCCETKPRCLKCNQNHQTNKCELKERVEKPTCINCGKIGHVA
ncbi:hypothetical protein AVEN_110326-1 [Araneus ventricosus]|uniref:Pre-C2HC domain-containing protein n=1 Tax=Araneus ventricosus TaxID=182803 RepID=A0A4Y2SZ73_ARAVE|nr:hypothetical protein AVEN_110326-1 [Araneus ventricosus]